MELSIIIVNWNTKKLLEDCLSSIYSTYKGIFEVIVVDNASVDGSSEMVINQYKDVILIRNNVNKGFAEGNNQGLAVSKGQYILLLNSDIVVNENSIFTMLNILKENSDIGVVSCQLLFPNGKVQPSCRSFPTPKALLYETLGLSALLKNEKFGIWKMNYFDHASSRDVDQPMMSSFMFRRKCYNIVGGLDTDFPIYFNDVDWCYRLKKQTDYRIHFTADANMIHYYGESGKKLGLKKVWYSTKGLYHFYRKHYVKNSMSFGHLLLIFYCFLTFFARIIINSILKLIKRG